MEFKKIDFKQEPTTTKAEEPVDTSTIDRVMRLNPDLMTVGDLDTIIAYWRKARALFETGVKPKRGANAAGEKPDLSNVLAALTGKSKEEKPKPTLGIRRI